MRPDNSLFSPSFRVGPPDELDAAAEAEAEADPDAFGPEGGHVTTLNDGVKYNHSHSIKSYTQFSWKTSGSTKGNKDRVLC